MRCETSTNRKLRISPTHETEPSTTAPAQSDNFFLQRGKKIPLLVEFRILLYLTKREFFSQSQLTFP
jgi:hypothetical protein